MATNPQALDETASTTTGLTCKYTNKKCFNPRTRKSNGALHTLCEVHRQQINRAQNLYAQTCSLRDRQARRERVLARLAQAKTMAPLQGETVDAILYDDDDESFDPIESKCDDKEWTQEDISMLRENLLED
ncbi:hypothetical protein LEN26_013053 [Aphanomyces euteiches]|nr:hypothetical protein AeMF1_019389 [Aphanomyces euteiches]KAH9114315.1 hypothetical protein LEN26_013053 [Aphanomyces euteiches]KAH9196453.1 hypothetical protein AeNC1_001568 [Aphanomyces euteiches]